MAACPVRNRQLGVERESDRNGLSNSPPAIIAFIDRLIAFIPQLIGFFQNDSAFTLLTQLLCSWTAARIGGADRPGRTVLDEFAARLDDVTHQGE